jgi:lipopolysaccharide transport system permease protein
MITTLIDHKDLILYKSWADLRSEARRYYISYAWWILEPIMEMFIFYLVFGVLLVRGGENFIQFLLVGLVTWKWFGTTVQHCGISIISARGIISQSSLPKIIFPTVHIVTDSFKALIVLLLVIIFLVFTGFPINKTYVVIPFIAFIQVLLIMAVGYSLGAIVPYFPDLTIIIGLFLRIMFYLSGIFYDPSTISEDKRALLFLNPMAKIIDTYRGVLMHQAWPDPYPLIKIGLVSVFIIIGASTFIKRNDTIYPKIVR